MQLTDPVAAVVEEKSCELLRNAPGKNPDSRYRYVHCRLVIKPIEPLSNDELFQHFISVFRTQTTDPVDTRDYTLKKILNAVRYLSLDTQVQIF